MRYLITLLLSTCLFAQANQVFTINPSVYSSGMGNTGVAHANIKNLYHNPAFITLDTNYTEFSNVAWLPDLTNDMQYQNVIYTNAKGFGFELFYFDYGNQVQADESGIIIGSFESSSYRLSTSYGMVFKDWSLGGRFNIYNHDFIDSVDIKSSFGIDLGAYKEFLLNDTSYVSLGIALKDIGTESSFVNDSSKLPNALGLGVKYQINSIALALDTKFYSDYYSAGFGSEYYYKDLFKVRLGYYLEPEYEVDYYSFGAGINAKGIGLDIAYLFNPNSFHNKTFMLSLGFEL